MGKSEAKSETECSLWCTNALTQRRGRSRKEASDDRTLKEGRARTTRISEGIQETKERVRDGRHSDRGDPAKETQRNGEREDGG